MDFYFERDIWAIAQAIISPSTYCVMLLATSSVQPPPTVKCKILYKRKVGKIYFISQLVKEKKKKKSIWDRAFKFIVANSKLEDKIKLWMYSGIICLFLRIWKTDDRNLLFKKQAQNMKQHMRHE